MNEVWDLDALYHGFQDPALEADLEQFKQTAAQMANFVGTWETLAPGEALRRGIRLEEQTVALVEKLAGYASLRQAADTRDPEPGSQMGRIMGVYASLAGPDAAFRDWAAKLPNLEALVAEDPELRPYAYYFSTIAQDGRYLLPEKCEEILAKMSLSGGEAWSELQQYLTSTVPVTYRGQTTNLSTIRNLANDPDPQVRKDAYEAELRCYDRIKDPVAYALNAIKLETISDCQVRGYESPLAQTLQRSRMRRETLEAMLEAMDEYLPQFWKYLRTKARVLGHANGLPWYDLLAPMGRSSRRFTTQEARDYLVDLFAGFDGELSQMVARAFDNAWIDFYPRDGKAGGAFCASLMSLGESRILTNFTGTFSDVVTLAHELGHAFHNQCLRDHRILNRDYSMPVAETASTFNECVVMASAIQRAEDPQEKLALIESQLQDATQIICDIYSRYRFESQVFARREAQFMNADTLCQLMREAQLQSYGDGLDPEHLHPYMWVCKSHYYGATFYNFPYAFGGLFARGLYAQYAAEGAAFVPKYKKLLHTTPVASVEDTARVAGVDLTDPNFWRSALQTIGEQIDQFCELVEG